MSAETLLGIGHLTVIKTIGQGAFGNVFLSHDTAGQLVCVKSIDASTKESRAATEHEIRVLSSLDHPNIIRFLWFFEQAEPETVNIVMEFAGTVTTIRDVIDERCQSSHIDSTTLLDYFVDIALGLEYLRRRNIVHRDIKPENLLVASDGHVKIADFGLSIYNTPKRVGFGGTVRYMSPEALDSKKVGFKSDVWSFGCVLHELCTGDHPLGEADIKCEIQGLHNVFFIPNFEVCCLLLQDADLWTELCERMLTYSIKERITIQSILKFDKRITSHKYVQKYLSKK